MIRWLIAFFRKPAKPRELVCVPYTVGDRMLRHNEGWRLAPEEDTNRTIGMVYLERDAVSASGEPK